MQILKSSALQIIFVALSGFIIGAFVSPAEKNNVVLSRTPSATADTTNYDDLPCATPEELKNLSSRVNFVAVNDLEGSLCGDKSYKEKIGKLLKYIYDLKTALPATWRGGAVEGITEPFKYLSSNLRSLGVDFAKDETYAYNRGAGDVRLGKIFFEDSPLDALNTLVHEARHSSPNDPGHVRCKAGDRAQQTGACDEWFRVDNKAGAYAYQVSLNFGLAKHSQVITSKDREGLVLSSLATLGTRFNAVPEFLSLPFDTLVVLDEMRELYIIHPILKILYPIEIANVDSEIAKIKFRRGSNGVYAITENGKVYANRPFKILDRNMNKVIPEDFKIVDIEQLTFGSIDMNALIYFVNDENEIWLIEFDGLKRKYVAKKSSYQTGQKIKALVQANTASRYVLLENGKLGTFDSPNNTESKITVSMFQDPEDKGWLYVNGGLFYEDMFGINKLGTLFYRSGDEIKESSFKIPERALKFYEATNFRVILSDNGKLFLKTYSSEEHNLANEALPIF